MLRRARRNRRRDRWRAAGRARRRSPPSHPAQLLEHRAPGSVAARRGSQADRVHLDPHPVCRQADPSEFIGRARVAARTMNRSGPSSAISRPARPAARRRAVAAAEAPAIRARARSGGSPRPARRVASAAARRPGSPASAERRTTCSGIRVCTITRPRARWKSPPPPRPPTRRPATASRPSASSQARVPRSRQLLVEVQKDDHRGEAHPVEHRLGAEEDPGRAPLSRGPAADETSSTGSPTSAASSSAALGGAEPQALQVLSTRRPRTRTAALSHRKGRRAFCRHPPRRAPPRSARSARSHDTRRRRAASPCRSG